MDDSIERFTARLWAGACTLGGALSAAASRARNARLPSRERAYLFLLDAVAFACTVYRVAGMWLTAILTVRWDAANRSRALLPIGGRSTYRGAAVEEVTLADNGNAARAEYARRAISWMYRWHDVPDEATLRDCVQRFGLWGLTGFTVRLYGGPRAASFDFVAVSGLDLDAGGTAFRWQAVHASARPQGASTSHVISTGAVPLGGLTLQWMARTGADSAKKDS